MQTHSYKEQLREPFDWYRTMRDTQPVYKHPEWEADIRRTFARRWVERGAQGGWYYQDASGKWVQK